jgi:hypothetical protein
MATNYNPSIVKSGLVLCLDPANPRSYPGSGTTITDISNSGNNGTFSGGGPAYSASNNGTLVFDGSNDMISVTTSTGFGNASLSPNQSMSFWYKHDDNTAYDFLCGFRNDSNYDFYTLIVDQGAGDFLEVRTRTAAGGGAADTNVNWPTSYNNVWKHISVTVSGSLIIAYLDGIQANSSNSLSGNYGASSGNFQVGMYAGSAFPMKGSMGQILFYNRAITAAEVKQNFNATKGRYGL